MEYSLMIAPFDFGGHNRIAARQFFDNYAFFELTPKQAKEYFKWYMEEIPHRLTLLWNRIRQDCPELDPFDYSPESLIPIWEWYQAKIKTIPKTQEEIEEDVLKFPKWIEPEIRKETTIFTAETLSLALDISIYLGEIAIRHHSHLQWGYRARPKNEFSANRPVILGLRGKRKYFNPSRITFVLVIKISEGDQGDTLYDLYRYWENEYFIPAL